MLLSAMPASMTSLVSSSMKPSICAPPRCTLHASCRGEQRASSSPSPPLEERDGERRPILDDVVRGDIPAGCCTNIFGVLAEDDDILSLTLSSKGGEGNGAAASERRDPCKVQASGARGEGSVLAPEVQRQENSLGPPLPSPLLLRGEGEAAASRAGTSLIQRQWGWGEGHKRDGRRGQSGFPAWRPPLPPLSSKG